MQPPPREDVLKDLIQTGVPLIRHVTQKHICFFKNLNTHIL